MKDPIKKLRARLKAYHDAVELYDGPDPHDREARFRAMCEAQAHLGDVALAEALLAEWDALRAGRAWQPIESIPPDTTVLLWWPGHGAVLGHVPYDVREAPWRPRVYTHWMPLPGAP